MTCTNPEYINLATEQSYVISMECFESSLGRFSSGKRSVFTQRFLANDRSTCSRVLALDFPWANVASPVPILPASKQML